MQERVQKLLGDWQGLTNKSSDKGDRLKEANRQRQYTAAVKDLEFWLGEVRWWFFFLFFGLLVFYVMFLFYSVANGNLSQLPIRYKLPLQTSAAHLQYEAAPQKYTMSIHHPPQTRTTATNPPTTNTHHSYQPTHHKHAPQLPTHPPQTRTTATNPHTTNTRHKLLHKHPPQTSPQTSTKSHHSPGGAHVGGGGVRQGLGHSAELGAEAQATRG